MNEYTTLFEDDDDIIAGSPKKRYWDILGQVEQDKVHNEFDKIVGKLATMEQMLMEYYHEDELDRVVSAFQAMHEEDIEIHKKNLYLEYGAKLIFAQSD